MDSKFSKEYVVDTLRELFLELHEVTMEDLKKSDPAFSAMETRYKEVEFLGNIHRLRNIMEDYLPLIFMNYIGDIPIKDILRQHIDILNEYKGIEIRYNSGNEMKYKAESKLGAKKGKKENIKSFQKKIKDMFSLMGVGTYPLSDKSEKLVTELLKALDNPIEYLSPNRTNSVVPKPKNKEVLTKFFSDLSMLKNDEYQKIVDEYLYNIT